MAASDIVSVHLVLSDRTRGLVDTAALGRLRPTGYLVNMSRAAIVDQAALLDALQHHRIAGAEADVFSTEPLPADDPLRGLPNLLATPHLGLCHQTELRRLLPRDGRGHRGLPRGPADPDTLLGRKSR